MMIDGLSWFLSKFYFYHLTVLYWVRRYYWEGGGERERERKRGTEAEGEGERKRETTRRRTEEKS